MYKNEDIGGEWSMIEFVNASLLVALNDVDKLSVTDAQLGNKYHLFITISCL